MDNVLLPIVIFAAAAVFLLAPVVALILVVLLRREHASLRATVQELTTRLERSEWWIGEIARRGPRAPREAEPPAAQPVTEVQPSRAAAAPAVSADVFASVNAETAAEVPANVSADAPASPATAPEASPSPVAERTAAAAAPIGAAMVEPAAPRFDGPPRADRSNFDLEKLVGVRLFAWLGGIGLFIGAAFFLQYSIEHDLIAPPLRVGIGLLTGAVALALGDYLRPKGDRAGQALGGAGVATLYASLFAARSLYHLIPSPLAFGAMALVTVLAGIIAIRRDAFVLAVIGLVGGFGTPWLLSTGEDHRYALFAYVALLDLGVLVVAARRQWVSLRAMALVCSGAIFAGWASMYLDAQGVAFAFAVVALLAVLFVASTWKDAPSELPWLSRRVIGCASLAGPFLTAFVIAQDSDLQVGMPLLAGYLAVLLAGAIGLLVRWKIPFFLESATAFAAITISSAVTFEAAKNERLTMLLAASLVPALLLAVYFAVRAKSLAIVPAVRRSAGLALGASILVAARAAPLDAAAPIAPLALYVAAHVAGLIAIGLAESSAVWPTSAQALWVTTLLFLASGYESSRLLEFLPFVLAPMLVFFALPLVTPRARGGNLGWIAGAASLVSHYAAVYMLARNVWPDEGLGAGAVVLGAMAFGMLSRARSSDSGGSSTVVATLAGVTLLFLTAAVPIALRNQWITLAWALEATALAWLYLRIPHKGLLASSALLSLATVIRLVANPSLWDYHPRSGVIVMNWYLYTFGLPALALFGAAILLRNDPIANRYRFVVAEFFAGGLLLFVLLNVEIADAYSSGQTIGIHLGASLGEDMTYSLAWGLFGLITLGLGMRFQSVKARMSALLVFLLAIGKVFLHDLWQLGSLYRVGSMVGLAAALLTVSFLTQRFILRGERQ